MSSKNGPCLSNSGNFNILQKKLNPSNFVKFTSQGRPGVDTILKMGKFYVWSHVVRTEAI